MSKKDLESWVTEVAKLVAPEKIYWCDGSEEEKKVLIAEMLKTGDLLELNEKTHPNCFLSAAYYVKASKNCGKFEVEHPNSAKKYAFPEIEKRNEFNLEVASIDIEEGDLLLFPSYLPHKVGKNESGEDRIVISFNVDIK